MELRMSLSRHSSSYILAVPIQPSKCSDAEDDTLEYRFRVGGAPHCHIPMSRERVPEYVIVIGPILYHGNSEACLTYYLVPVPKLAAIACHLARPPPIRTTEDKLLIST